MAAATPIHRSSSANTDILSSITAPTSQPESLQPTDTTPDSDKSSRAVDSLHGSVGLYLVMSFLIFVLVLAVAIVLRRIHFNRASRQVGVCCRPCQTRANTLSTLSTCNNCEPKTPTKAISNSRLHDLRAIFERRLFRHDRDISPPESVNDNEKQVGPGSASYSVPATPRDTPAIIISFCSPPHTQVLNFNPRYSLTNLQVPPPGPRRPPLPELPPLRPFNECFEPCPPAVEAIKKGDFARGHRRISAIDKENFVPAPVGGTVTRRRDSNPMA